MKTYNDIQNIPEDAKGAVIVIGNFDGVHLGHQALIKQATSIAKATNKKLGILTFEPHPRVLFQPDLPPARITTANLKAQRLEKNNVDFLFSLPFDWDFASQTADNFIRNILKDGLSAAHIIVGYDFYFGQLRAGNAETIKAAGIPITSIDAIQDIKNEAISSSRIRSNIRNGNINAANDLLGWDWEVQGEIFKGDRRGHELGFPTANVLMNDTIHPAYGVYACLVQIEGEDEWLKAATNIGIRPMFEVPVGQIEAHILDFPDRDIYGKNLTIKPVKRLRGEAKFSSLDELIIQIEKDCTEVREILS